MTHRSVLKPGLLLIVGLGGALGAVARYELVQSVHTSANGVPWGTFLANQTGAFTLAVFLTFLSSRATHLTALRALIAVGFLGAYTTFSSLAMETVLLVKHHRAFVGVAYLVGTVACGIAVAAVGMMLGRAAGGPAT